ncbi:hypothetical protein RFI_15369, partial [Reticulomyxa filosa]
LSSRSAKDATDAEDRLIALYNKFMDNEFKQKGKEPSDNDKVVTLLRASTLCMNLDNATDILTMFVHSDRIFSDLGRAMAYPDTFEATQHVVLRKWIPIDIDMEFRGFVYQNKFNALSQYNYIVYFERLKSLKDDIGIKQTKKISFLKYMYVYIHIFKKKKKKKKKAKKFSSIGI